MKNLRFRLIIHNLYLQAVERNVSLDTLLGYKLAYGRGEPGAGDPSRDFWPEVEKAGTPPTRAEDYTHRQVMRKRAQIWLYRSQGGPRPIGAVEFRECHQERERAKYARKVGRPVQPYRGSRQKKLVSTP